MNFVGYFMTLIVSLALGYIGYPLLFTTSEEDLTEFIHEVTVAGPQGRMTIKVDTREIDKTDLPPEVRLKKSVPLTNKEGVELVMEPGAKLDVLQFENQLLTLGTKAKDFKATIPFEDTDLLGLIAKVRLNKMLGISNEPKPKKPEKIAAMPKKPKKEVETPKKKLKPEKPKKDVGPLTKTLEKEALIDLMKQSITKKAVSEFSVDQVKKWEDGGAETIGPKDYQIGYATYGKETIFGFQPVVAKALVRNGKLEKWVYAKTGVAIP